MKKYSGVSLGYWLLTSKTVAARLSRGDGVLPHRKVVSVVTTRWHLVSKVYAKLTLHGQRLPFRIHVLCWYRCRTQWREARAGEGWQSATEKLSRPPRACVLQTSVFSHPPTA